MRSHLAGSFVHVWSVRALRKEAKVDSTAPSLGVRVVCSRKAGLTRVTRAYMRQVTAGSPVGYEIAITRRGALVSFLGVLSPLAILVDFDVPSPHIPYPLSPSPERLRPPIVSTFSPLPARLAQPIASHLPSLVRRASSINQIYSFVPRSAP